MKGKKKSHPRVPEWTNCRYEPSTEVINGIIELPVIPHPSRPGRRTNVIHELYTKFKKLSRRKCAEPFLKPVNIHKLGVPHYYEFVKKPMDLGTILQRIANNYYWQASEVIDDFELMLTNCFFYNPMGSYVHNLGIELREVFHDKLKNISMENERPYEPKSKAGGRPKKKLLTEAHSSDDKREETVMVSHLVLPRSESRTSRSSTSSSTSWFESMPSTSGYSNGIYNQLSTVEDVPPLDWYQIQNTESTVKMTSNWNIENTLPIAASAPGISTTEIQASVDYYKIDDGAETSELEAATDHLRLSSIQMSENQDPNVYSVIVPDSKKDKKKKKKDKKKKRREERRAEKEMNRKKIQQKENEFETGIKEDSSSSNSFTIISNILLPNYYDPNISLIVPGKSSTTSYPPPHYSSQSLQMSTSSIITSSSMPTYNYPEDAAEEAAGCSSETITNMIQSCLVPYIQGISESNSNVADYGESNLSYFQNRRMARNNSIWIDSDESDLELIMGDLSSSSGDDE